MVSGHLQREGPGAPFICMYCFCGLWPIHPLLTGFFLASEFLLLRDSNKSKELKSGTFCILILAKCVWKLFPVWLPFNRYVSVTPDYTEDRKTIWGKSSFKNNTEGRKEGRKEGERKGSMTLREEYFSLGRKVPPDCILFFFFKVLWEDTQNTPWFEMSALLNFRNLALGAIWTLQGRSRPWISPRHTETDSHVPDSP